MTTLSNEFDSDFQEKVIVSLVHNKKFLEQVVDVLKPEYFDSMAAEWMVERIIDQYNERKICLTLTMLTQEGKQLDPKSPIRSGLSRLAHIVYKSGLSASEDLGYVEEKFIEFCKFQELKNAFRQGVDMLERNDVSKSGAELIRLFNRAALAGESRDLGHSYRDGLDDRLMKSTRKTVATPWDCLNRVIDGGLGAGELGCIIAPSGCHAAGTRVLMFDGTSRVVESIEVGDLLMGPDSLPRTVLRTITGREQMVRITPTQNAPSFVVNMSHILSLKHEYTKAVHNISVRDYLQKAEFFTHAMRLYRAPALTFQAERPTPDDPYAFGFSINKWTDNTHLPLEYKYASIEDRQKLLAGMIDVSIWRDQTGAGVNVYTPELIPDIKFLIHSLGLMPREKMVTDAFGNRCHRITAHGDTRYIPTNIKPRMQSRPQRNDAHTAFSVEMLPEDDFYGFTLDADHLYLTDDFVVHHNSGKSWYLRALATHAMRLGKNVADYTFELSENYVGLRYDAFFTGIEPTKLRDHVDEVRAAIAGIPGGSYIKYFPVRSVTASALASHMKRMTSFGLAPDLMIVDYADLMRSIEKSSAKHEELGYIYEEIRALLAEFQIPGWTASQSQRCLTLDTKVETPLGPQNIGSITVGESVMTHEGFKVVTNVFPVQRQPVYKITLKSGKTITCSANHEFPTVNGKLDSISQSLKIGDVLLTK